MAVGHAVLSAQQCSGRLLRQRSSGLSSLYCRFFQTASFNTDDWMKPFIVTQSHHTLAYILTLLPTLMRFVRLVLLLSCISIMTPASGFVTGWSFLLMATMLACSIWHDPFSSDAVAHTWMHCQAIPPEWPSSEWHQNQTAIEALRPDFRGLALCGRLAD